jgi:hypothetical protein
LILMIEDVDEPIPKPALPTIRLLVLSSARQ